MSSPWSGPVLWYANRGTGVVLLVLFTVVVLLGLTSSTNARPSKRIPRFVAQGLHRNLTLLATIVLVGHIAVAVIDDYVDLTWRDALVPFGAAYRPFEVALAAVSVDLLLAVGLTSLVRIRLSDRVWRAVHWLAYPSWAAALWHTISIGTDMSTPWLRWLVTGCFVSIVLGVLARTVRRQAAARAS